MDVNRILVYRGLCGIKLESQCLAIGFTYIFIALTGLLVTRYLNLKLLHGYIYYIKEYVYISPCVKYLRNTKPKTQY